MRGNHAVISEKWRYIRYHDGSEELYDRKADPNEYRNLAAGRDDVKRELAKWIPKENAADAPERTAFDFDFGRYEFRKKTR
jgi:arylsulfatase A-like enzyme